MGGQRIGVVPFCNFGGDGHTFIQPKRGVLLAEEGFIAALCMTRRGVAGRAGSSQR
ncbi:hypothetical protein D3C87_2208400 [compost metagenome]